MRCAYMEYTRAMLETCEPIKKAAATLSQCRLDGETDSSFIGLYGGLIYLDGKYDEAMKLWNEAKELNFSDEERTRRQFVAYDPLDRSKKLRFSGSVVHPKPTFVLIQPDEGPVIISRMTVVENTILQRGLKVDFELSFSAKGPLAENLRLV